MYFPSEMLMSPRNTGRPVDARWQRVTDLADRGEPASHEWDDDWVRRGLDYFNRLRACRDDADRERLAEQMRDVHAAYGLYTAGGKLARGIIEARVLAGQTIDEVAAACGLTPGAVEVYERLFFEVRAALHASMFVYGQAIEEKHFYGLTEDDCDVFLKWLAYEKGPLMLEQGIRYFQGGWSVPARLEEASREELEELSCMLRIRAVVLARVLPFVQFSRALRLWSLTEELDSYLESRATTGANEPLCAGIDVPAVPLPTDAAPGVATAGTNRGIAAPEIDPAAWWSVWREAVLAA